MTLLVHVSPAESQESAADSADTCDQGIQDVRAGQYREGYELLVPCLISRPEDPEVRLSAAWSAAFLGRTYEAADLLTPLDERDPRVQFLWGKLLLDKRDWQGSIEILEPLLAGAPGDLNLDIRRVLAEAYLAAGQATRAVPLLEGHVGDSPVLALDLALARYESGDVQGASEVLAPHAKSSLARMEGSDETPGDPATLGMMYEYGRILVTSGRHQEAVPYLEASVRLAPDCRQCWHQIAQAYAASGRGDEAEAARDRFETLLESEAPLEERQRQEALDQQDPTGKAIREAVEVFREGRTEESLAILEAEARLRPNDPRPLLTAAQILLDRGHGEEALLFVNRAIELAPDYANGYFVRGTISRAMGDSSQARADYMRTLELAPGHRGATEGLEGLGTP